MRRDEVPSRNLRLPGLVVLVAVTLLPVPARAADPPVNLVAPTVEGTPTYRERLTAAPGGWTPAEGLAFAYQWLRDGAPVAGATTASYRLDLDDLGHTLAVSVTATDATGAQVAAASAPTTPVAKAAFEVLDKPVVTGVPRFTRTLTADKPRLQAAPDVRALPLAARRRAAARGPRAHPPGGGRRRRSPAAAAGDRAPRGLRHRAAAQQAARGAAPGAGTPAA